LIHLTQEHLAPGLLALAKILGITERQPHLPASRS
jgi:hypothetical protein